MELINDDIESTVCKSCGHVLKEHTARGGFSDEGSIVTARIDCTFLHPAIAPPKGDGYPKICKCSGTPMELFGVDTDYIPHMNIAPLGTQVGGGRVGYNGTPQGTEFSESFKGYDPKLIKNEDIEYAVNQLFAQLDDEGFLQNGMSKNPKYNDYIFSIACDDVKEMQQFIFRIGEILSTDEGDAKLQHAWRQFFNYNDIRLMIHNSIVIYMLKCFELIPKIFRKISTDDMYEYCKGKKHGVQRKNGKKYLGKKCISDGDNYKLGNLLQNLKIDFDCGRIKNIEFNLIDKKIRDAIAHNNYWWEGTGESTRMVFKVGNNGNKLYALQIETVLKRMLHLDAVLQAIFNECKERNYLDIDQLFGYRIKNSIEIQDGYNKLYTKNNH